MDRLSTTEQATKAAKELILLLNNPGPKKTFTLGEGQFHDINRLATLFHNVETQQPNTTVVPREVPMVAPPRTCMTVALQRVIESRVTIILKEDNIE